MAFVPASAGGGLPPLPNLLPGSQGRGSGLTDPERPSLPGGGIPPIPSMDNSSVPSPPPMQANAISSSSENTGIPPDMIVLKEKAKFVRDLMKSISSAPPEWLKKIGIDPADINMSQVNAQAGLPPGSNAATVNNAPNGQASAPPLSMNAVGRGMTKIANMNSGPGLNP